MIGFIVFCQETQYVVVLWLRCCCLPSVNTICGRIMIGLSSVSKQNMWSYHDSNHNTTTYCVYWRKTTTTQSQYDHLLCLLTKDNDNPIIIRPHIVLTDGRQRQPNHITTTYCVYFMIGLSSVSKHDMRSYYDWVIVVFHPLTQYVVVLWLSCRCLPSVNIIRQPNHNTSAYCVYWRTTTKS
jgi:hypothetical protein